MAGKRKSKEIPLDVIRELSKDLAVFSPELQSEPVFPVIGSLTKIKTINDQTPIFATPDVSGKTIATLEAGAEHKLIGMHGDFFGIEHNNAASWVRRDHVHVSGISNKGQRATRKASVDAAPVVIGPLDGLTIPSALPGVTIRDPGKRLAILKVPNAINAGTLGDYIGIKHVDSSQATEQAGLWNKIKDNLIGKAVELQNKYRDNPYVAVRGFSIELGLSPSLSIEFELRSFDPRARTGRDSLRGSALRACR